MVTEEDFLAANRELIPSVSAKELEHYSRVRAQFETVDDKVTATNGNIGEEKAAATDIRNGNTKIGLPEWQMPVRPKANGNIHARPRSSKGKGKARATLSDMNEEDEYEENFRPPPNANGIGANGFQEAREEDDEGLY